MPIAPTYPGVYIEEIPSGVRTITGVSTSIAAFIGWAARGPVNKAQRVLSFQDFERHHGGLDRNSLLGYAVQHFFANGGQDAYIIRLVADSAATAAATLDGILTLTAKSPGSWANDYGIVVRARTDDATRFRLAVVVVQPDGVEITVETFDNLSMVATDRRFVQAVIGAESAIINASVTGTPTSPPANTGSPSPRLTGGLDGDVLVPDTATFEAKLRPASGSGGVFLLDHVDLFNLLCVPGETNPTEVGHLLGYCRERRAFMLVDCPETATLASLQGGPHTALTGADAINAAFYFPWLMAPDPLQENRPRAFPPCGFMAGIYARTDANRGVFKAPAGTEASLTGVMGLRTSLTDRENGILNPLGINCLRTFAVYGTVVWGGRTLHGADERGSEWKYIPVRRLALFLEESLYRGTQWVVFEPNDEPLWAQIRLNIAAFLQNLFRQGAFQGKTPREAYFVKCDKDTTTQNDINLGIVNIVVGFAPLKPAEFVILKIQQMAGQLAA
jgi:phage tail sheath protein FI